MLHHMWIEWSGSFSWYYVYSEPPLTTNSLLRFKEEGGKKANNKQNPSKKKQVSGIPLGIIGHLFVAGCIGSL